MSFSAARSHLRVLPFGVASGSDQMAQDEALLEAVRQGEMAGPCLRFYQWSTVTLSVGYHQSVPAGLLVPWVRRPTGGRAVLHQASGPAADLTYALVVSTPNRQRRQVYGELCRFLQEGLARLGAPLTMGGSGRAYQQETSCFRTATAADLCWQGQKVIGSAQVWRGQTVLQHGTILLDPDHERWEQVLPGSSQSVIGLNGIRQQQGLPPVSVAELMAVLTQAAVSCLAPVG